MARRKNPSITTWLLLGGGAVAAYYLLGRKKEQSRAPTVAEIEAYQKAARGLSPVGKKLASDIWGSIKGAVPGIPDGSVAGQVPVPPGGSVPMGSTLSSRGYGSLGGTSSSHTLSSRGYGSLS